MDKVKRSPAFLRRRKMMLMLPVLVIPFLTMGFWALGGGKDQVASSHKSQGLNLNLPNASLNEDKVADKLSFYEKAQKDSAKLQEEIKNDPYYQKQKDDIFPGSPLNMMAEQTATKYHQSLSTTPFGSSARKPEDEIMRKVALLQEQLTKSQETGNRSQPADDPERASDLQSQANPSSPAGVDRLESMIKNMNTVDTANPEMNQMSSMLDKILDIQHPDRVKERIKERSLQHKQVAFPVCKLPSAITTSLLDTAANGQETKAEFYGVEKSDTSEQNAIQAVVDETQTVVEGSVIRLRLENDIYVAGNLVTRESVAYGICSLNGERLNVAISWIRSGANIFPVKLEVYDMDGLPGIFVPGAISRDAAKQSADNSLQMMELSTMDPSLKAQAAATGINAVKNLLSRKAKLVKVTVKAGYKVLLVGNENS